MLGKAESMDSKQLTLRTLTIENARLRSELEEAVGALDNVRRAKERANRVAQEMRSALTVLYYWDCETCKENDCNLTEGTNSECSPDLCTSAQKQFIARMLTKQYN